MNGCKSMLSIPLYFLTIARVIKLGLLNSLGSKKVISLEFSYAIFLLICFFNS